MKHPKQLKRRTAILRQQLATESIIRENDLLRIHLNRLRRENKEMKEFLYVLAKSSKRIS